VKFPRNARWE